MTEYYKELKKYGKVKLKEKLSKHTSFNIGGEANFFIEVDDENNLINLLNFLQSENINYFILGGGSNVLFSDNGFEGVIINIKTKKVSVVENIIEAESGVMLSQIVNLALKNCLSGFEWGVGIPGTIGGAIRGNAGAMGKDTSICLDKVKIWRDGEILEIENKNCQFGYRESLFKKNNDVILSGTFILEPVEAGQSKKIMQEYLQQRTGRYPSFPSAGSFFKNIDVNKWSGKKEDLPAIFWERGKIPVGWLVEQVNMKGYTVNGAKVSDEHGNFIINFSNGSQADVLSIVEEVKEKVYNKFGIELEPEVEIIHD